MLFKKTIFNESDESTSGQASLRVQKNPLCNGDQKKYNRQKQSAQ
jgi:hypothetical protein